MTKNCPNCGAEMEYIEPEPDVGIVGGYECTICGHMEDIDNEQDD